MLQGIGNKFIDDKTEGDGRIQIQKDVFYLELQSNILRVSFIRVDQMLYEKFEIIFETNIGKVIRLI